MQRALSSLIKLFKPTATFSTQMASIPHCSESQATGLTLPGGRNAVLLQAKGFSPAHLHSASAHVTPPFGWCPTRTLSLLPQPSLVLLPIGHILILQVSAWPERNLSPPNYQLSPLFFFPAKHLGLILSPVFFNFNQSTNLKQHHIYNHQWVWLAAASNNTDAS